MNVFLKSEGCYIEIYIKSEGWLKSVGFSIECF
jgi:hypothetical protein